MLLGYQQTWVEDKSPVKVIEKSRRIGLTFGSAFEAVETAALGVPVWYVGYDHEMGKEFISDCLFWVSFFEQVHETKILRKHGQKQLRFKNKAKITALSSNPRTLRGKKGLMILDEAAFHDSLKALLKAAIAVTMWGGRCCIISTHFGSENPFNKLVEDIREGKKSFSLHRVTFVDAINDGLYERICMASNIEATEEGKQVWRKRVLDDYGEFADEELNCIPDKLQTSYFPRDLLVSCTWPCQMLRFDFDDATAQAQHSYKPRAVEMVSQIERDVVNEQIVIGFDFGRTQDLTAIAIMAVDRQLVAKPVVIIELHNCPFKLQEELLHALFVRYRTIVGIALDGTGNGSYLAEAMTQFYGHLADNVSISSRWYAETFGGLKEAMQSKRLYVPQDVDVLSDFASVRIIDGIPRVPHERNKSTLASSGRVKARHGDSVIAVALAFSQIATKCLGVVAPSGYTRGGTHERERKSF